MTAGSGDPAGGNPVLVLIGLPASGKTTAGRRAALRLGLPFADSDVLVEQIAGASVPDIFATGGEAAFRALEEQVVVAALDGFPGVLALGGGAVLSEATRLALRRNAARIVYLVTTPVHAVRYVRGGHGRPLLHGAPADRLAELAAVRGPLYEEVCTVRVLSGGRPLRYVVDELVQIATRSEDGS